MYISENISILKKLEILSDAAKYDVACTSSGVSRSGHAGCIGNSSAAGICHSFSEDGRCISLLKILYTNECTYDCRYCVNRASNDTVRTSFTPDEVCALTLQFYRRNYIEGLFLSSGITHNPTYTMEQLYKTLFLLRHRHHFLGYIHVKAIPGSDPVLLEKLGYLADRMSVNLELPTAQGLRMLAPNKTRETILRPMRTIKAGIESNNGGAGLGAYWASRLTAFNDPGTAGMRFKLENRADTEQSITDGRSVEKIGFSIGSSYKSDRLWLPGGALSKYAPAGQSTQMIVGAAGESDYEILTVTEALYRKFNLKRVFYSAFLKVNDDSLLPDTPDGPPLLREHRLYQADWLMRYYGFNAVELVDEKQPNIDLLLDPKCSWALRHLEFFPVDVAHATYEQILRVPGIGVKSARRIIRTRKTCTLSFEALKKMGVVLKRARYFIICAGKGDGAADLEHGRLRSLIASQSTERQFLPDGGGFHQLSLVPDIKTGEIKIC